MRNNNNRNGIVIPAEWTSDRFDGMSDDEIEANMLRLDADAFYRMAKAVGINLSLLTRAGYEYRGLSHLAIAELDSLLPGRTDLIGLLREKYGKYEGSRLGDFDYVLSLSSGLMFLNDSPVTEELMRMLVEQYPDERPDARLEILEKYGDRFQTCAPYNRFVSMRSFASWFNIGINREDIERLTQLKELLSAYQMLKGGGEFIIQSASVKNRKVTISNGAGSMLADMILNAAPSVYKFDVNPDEADNRAVCRALNKEISEILGADAAGRNRKLFFYAADAALHDAPHKSITDHYVFIYRLAKFFNHIPPMENENFTDGYARKEIADAVRRQVASIRVKDKDGSLLKQLLDD